VLRNAQQIRAQLNCSVILKLVKCSVDKMVKLLHDLISVEQVVLQGNLNHYFFEESFTLHLILPY